METIRGFARYAPELHFTASGVPITTFTLYDTPTGEFKKKVKVVTWENLADECINKLALEDYLFLKGYYKDRSWTKADGVVIKHKEFTAKQIWIIEDGKYIEITLESYRDKWKGQNDWEHT